MSSATFLKETGQGYSQTDADALNGIHTQLAAAQLGIFYGGVRNIAKLAESEQCHIPLRSQFLNSFNSIHLFPNSFQS